jgi:tetratricopeptide (TPR) repeat protein
MRRFNLSKTASILALFLAMGWVLLGCADESPSGPVVVDLVGADEEVQALIGNLVAQVNQAANPETPAALDQSAIADAQGRLGMAYEANGFAEAALESYRNGEALAPGDPRWPYYQALLRAHQGTLEDAMADMQRSLALDGDFAPGWLWLGTWQLDQGDTDQAEAAFARARAWDGGAPATVGAARVALARNEPLQAVELLEALPTASTHPYVYKLLGQAYGRLGRSDDAREVLGKVTSAGALTWTDPRSEAKREYEVSIGARLARIRAGIGRNEAEARLEEMLEDIEALRERHPDHQGVLTTLAEVYRRMDRPGAALEVLRHGIDVHPELYAFRAALAELYIRAGQGGRAVPHLEQAIELSPEVAWPHAQIGLVRIDQGEVVEGLESLLAAHDIDPADATVNYYIGEVLAAQQKFANALDYFSRAVAQDDQFALAYVGLGRTLTVLGDHEDAERALHRAAELGTHPRETERAMRALELSQAQ